MCVFFCCFFFLLFLDLWCNASGWLLWSDKHQIKYKCINILFFFFLPLSRGCKEDEYGPYTLVSGFISVGVLGGT